MRFFLLLLWLSGASPLFAADALTSSIIRVHSYVQRPDYDAPWANKASEKYSHLALVVEGKRILVSAFAVRSAKHLEAEKIGDSKRYPLKVKFFDPVVNLALLEFEADMPPDLEPIAIGDDLELGSTCTIYEADNAEAIVGRSIRLREVALKPGVLTSYPLPQYSLEIRKPGYGWFEPLIRSGKVVGAAVSQAGSTVFALPASLMKRFLAEQRAERYRGFGELGISFAPMLSQDLRKFAKVADREDGVYIQEVKTNSPFADALKPGDVLIELAETPVSARGSYEHPLWGRLSIVARLPELYAGEEVELKFLRDGKEQTVSRVLRAYDPTQDRIPVMIEENPRYLIMGGLVIQELTQGLLQSWGPTWRKRAPLPYLFEEGYHSWPGPEGNERLVVLQRVLPIDFNKGYHDLEDYFITSVNGRLINNLSDVEAALAQPEKKDFARFQLEPGSEEIILSTKDMQKVHTLLKQRYSIPEQAKFWEPKN